MPERPIGPKTLLVLPLVVAALACTHTVGESSTEADRLRTAERERLRALVAGDTAAAAGLHAADFQLITPLGEVLSRAQYLGQLASGEIDYLEWEPDSIAVRVHGDAAVVRYQSSLRIAFRGRDLGRRRIWHTDAYERRDGRWQVVWSQATFAE